MSDGNDLILATAGSQTIDGQLGVDTVDFSTLGKGVTAHLGAKLATVVTAATGHISAEASILTGENGYQSYALLTSGISLASSGLFNGLNGASHTIVTNMDGIGATQIDANTVRIFVNHETSATQSPSYKVDNGSGGTFTLSGARIDYFDIDRTTFAIKDSGIAYDRILDPNGNVVSNFTELGETNGLSSFCSSALFEANAFGAGRGVVDKMYFTGQESGGRAYMLDVANGDLWAVGEFGLGAYENAAQLDTGNANTVAFLLTNDRQGSPMFMYVGTKHAGGDFLDRNGLRDGQLYYWKADNADTLPTQFTSGTRTGTWVAIDAQDVSKAGQAGYDNLGLKSNTTLENEAKAGGAFEFSRPEDTATNPANGAEAVFAATGGRAGIDVAGTVYAMTFDFSQATPKSTARILYDGDTDATKALRNPDNLVWSSDGFIYVQENKAADLYGPSATNSNEASILKLNPATGAITRVAEIDRAAVPAGFVDSAAGSAAAWESSGILDVSTLFGQTAGKLFLSTLQAGNITTSPVTTGLGERDSALLLLTAPGVNLTPAADYYKFVSIENITGTNFADAISGNSGVNVLRGLGGNDVIDGAAGNDVIDGGSGIDRILGGSGNDKLTGGTSGDRMAGGTGNDTYVVDSASDILFETSGTDAVWTSVSRTLGTGFEELRMTGTADITGNGSSSANKIIGNSGDNTLRGNSGNDSLSGSSGTDKLYGGLGTDTLTGGSGRDAFVFDTKPGSSSGTDRITDFVHGTDKIHLAKSAFAAISGSKNAALSAAQFQTGSAATQADDRIIYNKSTGVVLYDSDGSGAAAAIKIAVLSGSPDSVSRSDFFII